MFRGMGGAVRRTVRLSSRVGGDRTPEINKKVFGRRTETFTEVVKFYGKYLARTTDFAQQNVDCTKFIEASYYTYSNTSVLCLRVRGGSVQPSQSRIEDGFRACT